MMKRRSVLGDGSSTHTNFWSDLYKKTWVLHHHRLQNYLNKPFFSCLWTRIWRAQPASVSFDPAQKERKDYIEYELVTVRNVVGDAVIWSYKKEPGQHSRTPRKSNEIITEHEQLASLCKIWCEGYMILTGWRSVRSHVMWFYSWNNVLLNNIRNNNCVCITCWNTGLEKGLRRWGGPGLSGAQGDSLQKRKSHWI